MEFKNKIFVLGLTAIISACGGDGGDNGDATIQVKGTWKSDSCSFISNVGVYSASRYVFDEAGMTQHIDFHDFSDCSDEPMAFDSLFPPFTRIYTLGGEVITEEGLTATALNLTDPETGETSYTIIKLESFGGGERISFGARADDGEVNDGSTEERRISSLVMDTYYIKQ